MNWLERLNALEAAPFSGQIEVLHFAYAAHLPDNVPHRHTFFEVCLVGQYGIGLFSAGDQKLEIVPGDLFLARPGIIHQIQNSAQPYMELFWIAFDVKRNSSADEIAALWRAFTSTDSLIIKNDNRTTSLWNALRSVAQSEEVAGKTAQLCALREALLLSIAQGGSGNVVPSTETPARGTHHLARFAARYMQDNMGRKISLDEVAAHVHLSPRHLGRLFLEFAGVSPAAYLETARLDRARHLLHSTARPIKEIALSVGYDDVHYFTRLFTKRSGISPGQFRRGVNRPVRIIQKHGDLV